MIKYLFLSHSKCCRSVSLETSLWAGLPEFDFQWGQWWHFLSSPPHPDQLWCPPSFLSKGYWRFLPWGGKLARARSWLLTYI